MPSPIREVVSQCIRCLLYTSLQATWLDGGCVGVPTFFDNYIDGDKRLENTWRMGQQYALDGTPLWTNGWCGDPQMMLSYTKDVTNISGDATKMCIRDRL